MLRVWILSVEATVHFGIFSQKEADPIAQSALSEIQTDEIPNQFVLKYNSTKYKNSNIQITTKMQQKDDWTAESAKPYQKFTLNSLLLFVQSVTISFKLVKIFKIMTPEASRL